MAQKNIDILPNRNNHIKFWKTNILGKYDNNKKKLISLQILVSVIGFQEIIDFCNLCFCNENCRNIPLTKSI